MNTSRNNSPARPNNKNSTNKNKQKRIVRKTLKICKQVPASKINRAISSWHSNTGKNQWAKVKQYYAGQCNSAQLLSRVAEPNASRLNPNYIQNIAKNFNPDLNTNNNNL